MEAANADAAFTGAYVRREVRLCGFALIFRQLGPIKGVRE